MHVNIGAKLALGFSVPLLAVAVVVVSQIIGFARLQQLNARVAALGEFRSAARDTLLQDVNDRYNIRGYVLSKKASDRAAYDASDAKLVADIAKLQSLRSVLPALEQDLLDIDTFTAERRIESAHMLMYAKNDHAAVVEAYGGSKDPRVQPIAAVSAKVRQDTILSGAAFTKIIATAAAAASASADDLTNTLLTMRLVAIVAGIIAFAATLAVAIGFSRWLSLRLGTVSRAVETIVAEDLGALSLALTRLAEGDLRGGFTTARQPIDARGTDEIARLGRSHDALVRALSTIQGDLDRALGSLRDVVGGVITAARLVASASNESAVAADQAHHSVESIARNASEIAKGAEAQADRIASASTAIEELARAAQQIAVAAQYQTDALGDTASGIAGLDAGISVLSEHGGGLADAARTSSQQASAGAKAVQTTREGMQRVRGSITQWSESVEALVRRSADAADIVGTIEAIADQSNLLALNAAIEAARAGEHGRGFAVVADEVRKLAERSAKATREVGDILGAMQRETGQAAAAIIEAGKAMNDNAATAIVAGTALESVAASAARTDDVAHDVARRADDMRATSQRITSSIGTVSSAVEENAAAALQMRATTHEITEVMLPLAASAEQQSVAASLAASATGELAAGIGEIEAATRALRDQARELDALVARFTIDDAPTGRAIETRDADLPRFPLQHALR